MPDDASRKLDVNNTAADLARQVTGTEPVRGEDLFGDPRHREVFLRAKRTGTNTFLSVLDQIVYRNYGAMETCQK